MSRSEESGASARIRAAADLHEHHQHVLAFDDDFAVAGFNTLTE